MTEYKSREKADESGRGRSQVDEVSHMDPTDPTSVLAGAVGRARGGVDDAAVATSVGVAPCEFRRRFAHHPRWIHRMLTPYGVPPSIWDTIVC